MGDKMNKTNKVKFKYAIKVLHNDFNLKKTVIKIIILCTSMKLLTNLFYSIISSKENSIGVLVTIIITIISLNLKLIDELTDGNFYK